MNIEFVDLSREQVDAVVKEIQKIITDLVGSEHGRIKIKRRILGMMANGTIFASAKEGDSISFNYEVGLSSDALELIFIRLEAKERHTE